MKNIAQQPRKIIHIDMDAFYASVEQRDNPELRGKPVAVGGSRQRGVVAAASYEARKFGVRSAMASITAAKRCPDLIFVKPRFDVYRQISQQIREIFSRHTDIIEPLSLDEAYLDVTHDKLGLGLATEVAAQIRQAIADETGLTASAGVSYNKFIAKLASDQNKPNGTCVITPKNGPAFVASLPVKRFHGIGPKTTERMANFGIHTGADLLQKEIFWLAKNFGSRAETFFNMARAIDHRPVKPSRVRKSLGGERTYDEDKKGPAELHDALDDIVEIVWNRILERDVKGRTLTIKIKFSDFYQITKAESLNRPIKDREEFSAIGHSLLDSIFPIHNGIRLLGLTLSSLEPDKADTPQPSFTFD